MKIGYARVSTEDQRLTLQLDALKQAGCGKVFREKVSGAYRERPELNRKLDQLRDGDVVTVWKLDRLARSTRNLLEIVETIRLAGARFQSISEPWADTTTHAGKMIMTIFAGIAEFERDLIRERTGAGCADARRSLRASEEDERRATEACQEAAEGRNLCQRSRPHVQRPSRHFLSHGRPSRLTLRGNMTIYRLHVFLLDIAPPIWRRVELSSDMSLARLHKVLQAAMGWQDYHLHEFEVGGQRYGVPDPDYDLPGEVVRDSAAKLSKALPRKGASLLYRYDFGDNWAHSVILEDIVPVEPDAKYPRVLDGARACPPEDSGGPYGYADLVEILAKPRHKEHRRMREWAGKDFDPEKFSAKAANLLLKQTPPKGPKLKIRQIQ